jgi:hypothetical protein
MYLFQDLSLAALAIQESRPSAISRGMLRKSFGRIENRFAR